MTEVGCWDAYASKKKWTLHDCWKKPNRIFTRMTMIENLIFPRIFAHRAKDRSQLFGWYCPITIPEHHHGELVVILAVYISIYHLYLSSLYQLTISRGPKSLQREAGSSWQLWWRWFCNFHFSILTYLIFKNNILTCQTSETFPYRVPTALLVPAPAAACWEGKCMLLYRQA